MGSQQSTVQPIYPTVQLVFPKEVDEGIPSVNAFLHAKRTREYECNQREIEFYERCLKIIRSQIRTAINGGSMVWHSSDYDNLYYTGAARIAADEVMAEMRKLGYTVTLTELPKKPHFLKQLFKIEWTVDDSKVLPTYEDAKRDTHDFVYSK